MKYFGLALFIIACIFFPPIFFVALAYLGYVIFFD